VVFIYR